LDFSKLEGGKFHLEPFEFALRECVNRSIAALTPHARQKGLALTAEVEPDVPQILNGDSTRLHQLLINLGGNAVKFTERGEVALRVSLMEDGEHIVRLHFAVRDSGI